MFSYIPLQVKNECELCKKPYMSKHPLIQGREIYRMSSITNNTVKKMFSLHIKEYNPLN